MGYCPQRSGLGLEPQTGKLPPQRLSFPWKDKIASGKNIGTKKSIELSREEDKNIWSR